MSWGFSAKGQPNAVKKAVVDWKNPYDPTSADERTAREGQHVADVKQAIPEMIDTVLEGAPAGMMVDVVASGSEGSYGCEMTVKVTRLQVLMDPVEPVKSAEQEAPAPDAAAGEGAGGVGQASGVPGADQ